MIALVGVILAIVIPILIGMAIVALIESIAIWLAFGAPAVAGSVFAYRVVKRRPITPDRVGWILSECRNEAFLWHQSGATVIAKHKAIITWSVLAVVGLVFGGMLWGEWFFVVLIAVPIWLTLLAGISTPGKVPVRAHIRAGSPVRAHVRRWPRR